MNEVGTYGALLEKLPEMAKAVNIFTGDAAQAGHSGHCSLLHALGLPRRRLPSRVSQNPGHPHKARLHGRKRSPPLGQRRKSRCFPMIPCTLRANRL